VEVWDLSRRRLLYRGLPEEFKRGEAPDLEGAEWSPDGSWLALSGAGWWQWHQQTRSLLFMRPDGSHAHDLEVGERQDNRPSPYWGEHWPSWDWDPSGQAVYLLEEGGRLVRHSLPDSKTETIWEASASQHLPPNLTVTYGKIAVAPDGQQVALALLGYPYRRVGPDGAILTDDDRFFAFIVSSDGPHSQLIFKSPAYPVPAEDALHFTWSQDGKTLYLSRVVPVVPDSWRADRRAELIVWQEGDKAALLSALPEPSANLQTALLPDGDLLVSNGRHLRSIGPDGKLRSMPGNVVRSFADSSLLSLDNQGRAILRKWEKDQASYIAAVDLTTGELTRIYP
jgi:hypothetical protein